MRWLVAFGLLGLVWAQDSIQVSAPGTRPRFVRSARDYMTSRGTLLDAVAWAFERDTMFIDAPAWFREARFEFNAHSREAFRADLIRTFSIDHHAAMRGVKVRVLSRTSPAPELAAGDLSARTATRGSWGASGGTILCGACSIDEQIVPMLQHVTGAPVVDESGLGGYYRFKLSWQANDPGSLERALRDELGLLVAEEYRDLEFLVIDAAIDPFRAAHPNYVCEAESPVRELLEALPAPDDYRLAYADRIGPARQLAQRFPNDVFAAMRLQDLFRDKPWLRDDWNRALASYAAMPDRSTGEFLEARLRRSLDLARGLVARAPDFVWGRLALLELSNGMEAEREYRAVRALCPDAIAPFAFINRISDRAVLDQAVRDAGGALGGLSSDAAMRIRAQVWKARARLGGSPHPAVIRFEVMQMRLLDRAFSAAWRESLAQGYAILNDRDGAGWLDTRARKALPPEVTPQFVFARWRAISADPKATPDEVSRAAADFLETAARYPDLAGPVPAVLQVISPF